ncbi:uncharacterized protein LOC117173132 [Belonocnema kinseyi]|uniref:uncharacterized protein LOC117173132 n=1 Tax=Belonocnema kinseyi TaxID=2817044 RepID=UPI00143D2A77|nr:uncharacterized protein LOC117173132 [Belonocnema kinseyi]
MQLRLSTILSDEISCYARTPWLENINLKINEENSRIKLWSVNNECGIQVKNVQKEDEGFWRLVSKNGFNQTITDAVNVKILDKVNSIDNEYQIESGLGYNLVLAQDSKFCTVKRPNNDNADFELVEDCVVDLQEPTEADAGFWTAKFEVKGQIEEVDATAKLIIYQERLMSGYKKNETKYLHLYCNLVNYEGVPDLCRFSQLEGHQNAFHLSEGLSKGRYGYYGNGLANGQCGLTIENPEPNDFGNWYCRVGQVGKRILGGYIHIPSLVNKSNDVIFQSVSPVITSLTKDLILQCSVNIPLKYCWISGPNETILTPTEANFPDFSTKTIFSNSYSYFGKGLDSGECGVNITNAEEIHNGTWTCHMGPNSPGLEITANIDVRISETPLAARNKVVFVENLSDSASIKCNTAPNRVALQYCRFYSPSGTGINIDEEITKENPLDFGTTKIWFSGTSTKFGECGITLQNIPSNDIGTWRCAARLKGVKLVNEAFDTIEIILKDQKENETLTASANAGIAVGIMVLLGLTLITIVHLNKKIRGSWIPWQARRLPSADETPRSRKQLPPIIFNPVSARSSGLSSESDR